MSDQTPDLRERLLLAFIEGGNAVQSDVTVCGDPRRVMAELSAHERATIEAAIEGAIAVAAASLRTDNERLTRERDEARRKLADVLAALGRTTDRAAKLEEAADYAIDRLKAAFEGKVVRDMQEALSGYEHIRRRTCRHDRRRMLLEPTPEGFARVGRMLAAVAKPPE